MIVSTGLGSTGWFKSLITGAAGVARASGKASGAAVPDTRFPWESDFLYFTVREPFPSNTTGTSLIFGKALETLVQSLRPVRERVGTPIDLGGDGFEEGRFGGVEWFALRAAPMI